MKPWLEGGKQLGTTRTPYTSNIADIAPSTPSSLPQLDFTRVQTQIAQLQVHVCSLTAYTTPTGTIASGIHVALHDKSSNPTRILDSGANNHMTNELSTLSLMFCLFINLLGLLMEHLLQFIAKEMLGYLHI